MSNDKYESEMTATQEEVAAVLREAAEGVVAGSVRLGNGTDAVTVDIPEELTLEIELEAEDEGLSLEFELEWSHDGEEPAVSTDESLSEGEVEKDKAEDNEYEAEGENEPVHVGAVDESETPARFELFRDNRDEWRWRLRHSNGNVIATSGEGYTRKHNAKKGIKSVVRNSSDAVVTEESEN